MYPVCITGLKILLFVIISTTVTAQTTYNEKGLVSSEVTLPCRYNQATDGDIITVTWTVQMGGRSVNLYIKSGGSTGNQATPPDQYAGRVELVEDVKLKLTGVTLDDEQQYGCAVTASKNSETSVINLQVLAQPTAPQVQVLFDPPTSSMLAVPLNTTVTFTCTSTAGRPPATLNWVVTESGTVVSVNPTYTSSNNSQGVGNAMSTFNFTTTKYSVTYRVECVASGPDPIQTQRSTTISVTTEPDPKATPTTPKGQTVVTSAHISASKSPGQDGTSAPRAGGGLGTGGIVGIVIGVLAVLALVAALVYFLLIRKKRAGMDEKDGVESGDDAVTYHTAGHPGAPGNMTRPPPNQPEVMYAELDLKNAPAGSRRPYVATPDDSPTEYAQIRPNKPPRSSVPHTLAPDEKTEYASISKPKPSKRY